VFGAFATAGGLVVDVVTSIFELLASLLGKSQEIEDPLNESLKGGFSGVAEDIAIVTEAINNAFKAFKDFYDFVKEHGIEETMDIANEVVEEGINGWFKNLPKNIYNYMSGGKRDSQTKQLDKYFEKYGRPGLASGGEVTQGGRVRVGEVGPEVLDLPEGARVTPLSKMPDESKTVTVNLQGVTFMNENGVEDFMDLMIDVLASKGVQVV